MLRNQDNKVAFVRVDEDGALARHYEFMNTCHNMNIIVHTTGGDASSLNGKSESPNNFGVLPISIPYGSPS